MDTDEHYFASKFSRFAQISCANAKGCFAICYWLSAIGYRLSAIGYRLLAIGYRLSAIGYRLSAIGYRLSAIGYWLSAIDDCGTLAQERRCAASSTSCN